MESDHVHTINLVELIWLDDPFFLVRTYAQA